MVRHFLKSHIVFLVALAAAIVSCFIIPPNKDYLSYIDYKTLACLFSTLAVVCALKNIKFFSITARKIITKFKNFRICALVLIYITFIGSMFIANDMALITFLPLGWYVLSETNNEKYTPYLFVLQNISANLGGMLTPFGNPQNLYLYSKFNIPTCEFLKIMFPPFILAIALLTVCCFMFPSKEISVVNKEYFAFRKKRTVIYLILFVLSILMVFSIIPYYIGIGIIFLAILFLDRYALYRVDYFLLATFFMFFIFAGNVSQIPAVREMFSNLLEKNTFLVTVGSCQVISNVPSAILLSQFTDNYKELLLGVNIGSAGTMISSLASLITFSEYCRFKTGSKGKYFLVFTLFNLGFLVLLGTLAMLLR